MSNNRKSEPKEIKEASSTVSSYKVILAPGHNIPPPTGGVMRLTEESSRIISVTFPGFFGQISGNFRDVFGSVPGNLPGNFQDISGKIPGQF